VPPVGVRALESDQLSGHCGLRVRIGGERRVANDPIQTCVVYCEEPSRNRTLGRHSVNVVVLKGAFWHIASLGACSATSGVGSGPEVASAQPKCRD
jgi:hypothetical protein